MRKRPKIILTLIAFFLMNLNVCLAQSKSPIEVVEIFDQHYGGPLMDEIAELTTSKFRDNKPKSVWVVDTWKTLHKMKYERLNSSVIDSKVEGNKAIIVTEAKINTVAVKGDVQQKQRLEQSAKRMEPQLNSPDLPGV